MTTSVPSTRPPDGFFAWVCPYGGHLARPSPMMFSAISIWREGWTRTEVVDPHSIQPTANVFGLYWKPEATGQEQQQ